MAWPCHGSLSCPQRAGAGSLGTLPSEPRTEPSTRGKGTAGTRQDGMG